MLKRSVSLLIVLFLFGGLSASASEIDANVVRGRPNVSIGFSALQGFGLVTTANFPLDSRISVGGSFGYSFDAGNPYLADLFMNLQFVEPTARSPFSASLVGGAWGGTSDGIWLSKNKKDAYIEPELGVALSYMFNSRMTGRFNLVFGPSLGVELGYMLLPQLEGVFAISEQVIGVKFKIF